MPTLLDEVRSAGWHEVTWDGRNSGDIDVASGIYFAEPSCGGESEVQRLVSLQ